MFSVTGAGDDHHIGTVSAHTGDNVVDFGWRVDGHDDRLGVAQAHPFQDAMTLGIAVIDGLAAGPGARHDVSIDLGHQMAHAVFFEHLRDQRTDAAIADHDGTGVFVTCW